MESGSRRKRTSSLMRGIAVLATVLVAAGAISPAFGAKALTKAKVKKIAVKQINKAAPGLSVASAKSLTMYAQVTADGALVNALGIGAVTRPITGIYCLSGLAATPKGGVATVNFHDQSAQWAQFGLGAPDNTGTCPAGTQAFVNTINNTANTFGNAGFFVTIW